LSFFDGDIQCLAQTRSDWRRKRCLWIIAMEAVEHVVTCEHQAQFAADG
jgi:hypothetical protein